MTSISFPRGFRWGTATSSFQIEGAASTDGRRPSIWDEFCRVPGAIANDDDGTTAIDHYHRFPEDIALMRELGIGTYRFSVSWTRVMDGDRVNPKGLDFYERLVDALCEAGIAPWLTLYHWDLPVWLDAGWTRRDTAHRFAEYASAVHGRLGDRVDTWTTLNEPWCSAFLGYASGEHAPGHTDPAEAAVAVHHLLLAHGLAVGALREAAPDATIGISLNFTPALPASDEPADLDVVRRIDGTANRLFIEPITTGAYPEDVMDDLAQLWPSDLVHDGDMETIAAPIDVLGVNYYTTNVFRANAGGEAVPDRVVRGRRIATPHITAPNAVGVSRGLPVTDLDWEVDPGGLRDLLVWLHETYTGRAGISLVITENGAACPDDTHAPDGRIHDADRISYLRLHLQAVRQAMDAGADVRGYLLWSLIDNFEWSHGYAKRFGLVAVDADLTRQPKSSFLWYQSVARSGTIED
jgi:beta-glucosidase